MSEEFAHVARVLLARAERASGPLALFLDVDGTLVDIAPTPDSARAPGGLADLLRRLEAALDGALALISGREIADLDSLLHPFRGHASGAHGGEWRDGPGGAIRRLSPLDPELIAAAHALAIRLGVIFEDKRVSFALHYRGRERLAAEIEAGLDQLIACAPTRLTLLHGRKVFEVMDVRTSKSEGVARFMAAPPFLGKIPIMIGDDTTDIGALDACVARGGFGLRVAGGRFSLEDAEFRDPAAVRAWLAQLIVSLTATRSSA